jgi:hypothetical protein
VDDAGATRGLDAEAQPIVVSEAHKRATTNALHMIIS